MRGSERGGTVAVCRLKYWGFRECRHRKGAWFQHHLDPALGDTDVPGLFTGRA